MIFQRFISFWSSSLDVFKLRSHLKVIIKRNTDNFWKARPFLGPYFPTVAFRLIQTSR